MMMGMRRCTDLLVNIEMLCKEATNEDKIKEYAEVLVEQNKRSEEELAC